MANSTTPILAGNTLISSEIESSIAADEKNSAAHTAPDVTKFVYDETSGYYYDYATGFYYDATSQYFYNSATQKYCYWDAVSSSYIPVENTPATPTAKKDGDSTAATSSTSTPEPQSSASVPEKAVDTKTTGPQKGAKTSQPVKSAAQIAKVVF
jgi:RNA-binding protein 5/10